MLILYIIIKKGKPVIKLLNYFSMNCLLICYFLCKNKPPLELSSYSGKSQCKVEGGCWDGNCHK